MNNFFKPAEPIKQLILDQVDDIDRPFKLSVVFGHGGRILLTTLRMRISAVNYTRDYAKFLGIADIVWNIKKDKRTLKRMRLR